MPEPRFSLKDFLFNQEKVTRVARQIKAVYPDFEEKKFVHTVVEKFKVLELKERIYWIRENLVRFLPKDYRQAVSLLLKSLPEACDETKTDNDFGDFIYAPYSDFVAKHGLQKKDLAFSLDALKEITTRFSAEDSIRSFLNAYPQETLATLLKWTNDSHYHVRRLASEGTRPRLPWCQKINLDVTEPLPILDALFSDQTRFVTRSVANHLNDISRTQPELVIQTLKKWQSSQRQSPSEMAFIIKHSLRTLVKQGNPQALELIGFSDSPQIEVSNFRLQSEQVEIGEVMEFSFEVKALRPEKLLIDYVLYFQGKNGTLKNKKVYKLTQLSLERNQEVIVTKKHPLRKNMTTRTLYPGEHKVELQINGLKYGTKVFWLGL